MFFFTAVIRMKAFAANPAVGGIPPRFIIVLMYSHWFLFFSFSVFFLVVLSITITTVDQYTTMNDAIDEIFVPAAKISHLLWNTEDRAMIFMNIFVFDCEIAPIIPVVTQNATMALLFVVCAITVGMVFCQVMAMVAGVFSIFFMISTIHWCMGAAAIFSMTAVRTIVSVTFVAEIFVFARDAIIITEDATAWIIKYFSIPSLFHLFFFCSYHSKSQVVDFYGYSHYQPATS